MEVNSVTAPVRNTPVIYATTNPAPTWAPIFDTECEDPLNYLGNCYGCNKPRHMKRDCQEKTKKNKGRDNPMEKEKTMKIVQEIMVKCNNKPEVFL